MAEFHKYQKEWDELLRGKTGPVFQYIEKISRQLELLAKAQVGKKTGALQSSIKSQVNIGSTGVVGLIVADNKIAMMHHNGTRAHIITPKVAQTLRFPSRGRMVYTKLVHHPGTKPNRVLTDNLPKVV